MSAKPEQEWPRNEGLEKDVLLAAGKKNMGVISKAMRHIGIFLEQLMYVHIRKQSI